VVVNKEDEEEKGLQEAPKCRYQLLDKLLSLLAGEKELNSVLAGYFAKVMQVLVEKRKLETLAYLFKYNEHIKNLLRRCNNKSIAEIVNKLLSNEDKFLTGLNGTEYAPQKKAMLEVMIANMTSNDGVLTANFAAVLTNLIETRQHLEHLLTEPLLPRIFEVALSKKAPSLIAGMTLLIAINRLSIPPPAPANEPFGNFGGGERKSPSHPSSRGPRRRQTQLRARPQSLSRPSPHLQGLYLHPSRRTHSSSPSRARICRCRQDLR
jgi:hypothetical protein